MNYQANHLDKHLLGILIIQLQRVAELQSKRDMRRLTLATEALQNIAGTISLLNEEGVTAIDSDRLEQLIQALHLESSLQN